MRRIYNMEVGGEMDRLFKEGDFSKDTFLKAGLVLFPETA
jgi:uncharacterized protein YqgQ